MNSCVHTVCMPTIQAKNLTLDGNWCPESTEHRMRAHNQVSMTGNDLSGLPPVYMYTLGSVNCIFENFDKLVVACKYGLRCFFNSSDYFVQKKTNMAKFDMVKISVFFFVQMTNWHYCRKPSVNTYLHLKNLKHFKETMDSIIGHYICTALALRNTGLLNGSLMQQNHCAHFPLSQYLALLPLALGYNIFFSWFVFVVGHTTHYQISHHIFFQLLKA